MGLILAGRWVIGGEMHAAVLSECELFAAPGWRMTASEVLHRSKVLHYGVEVPVDVPNPWAKRRDQRRRQLAEAAFTVLSGGGMQNFTAEAIAAEAGVSRRTFFNHFNSTTDALRGAADELFAWFSDRLEASDKADGVLSAVLAMASSPDDPEPLRRVALMARVGHNDAEVRHIMQDSLATWREWLEEFIAERALVPRSDVYISALAGAIISASETAVAVWQRRTGGQVTPETLSTFQAVLTETLIYVTHGFEAEGNTSKEK